MRRRKISHQNIWAFIFYPFQSLLHISCFKNVSETRLNKSFLDIPLRFVPKNKDSLPSFRRLETSVFSPPHSSNGQDQVSCVKGTNLFTRESDVIIKTRSNKKRYV